MSVIWVPGRPDEHLPGPGRPLAPAEVIVAELPDAEL